MATAAGSRVVVAATDRTWRVDAVVLAAAALLIRVPALVADRFLTYDDGVFGSSALLMRDGELPFRDIFSPQGPLFLPLVYLADLVGLRTDNAARLVPFAAGAVVTVATYAAGRHLTTRGGALLAAGLVTTSGSVLWTTAPITSDGPALALATTSVALAFGYRARPSTARAVAVGLTLGAALCIKVLVLPAAVPIGLLLLGRRRPRDVVFAVSAAVGVGLVATLPWGFGRVWDQYIEYHRDSARTASHAGAARKIGRTLVERDVLVVAAGILALVGAALPWRRDVQRREPPADAPPVRLSAGLLAAWAGGVVILLVLEPAFWRPQLAEVIPALALLAALRPPRSVAVLGVAAIVLTPWYLAHAHPMLWPGRADADERAAIADLRRLPTGADVITDEPGLAWRAGHRVPGELVDASIKRIEQGQITTGVIVESAAEGDVCAVLVWDDRYADLPGLPERLAERGYEETVRYGGPRVLYVRDECPARLRVPGPAGRRHGGAGPGR